MSLCDTDIVEQSHICPLRTSIGLYQILSLISGLTKGDCGSCSNTADGDTAVVDCYSSLDATCSHYNKSSNMVPILDGSVSADT